MTADSIGGVWTYALELASALAPSGVEVILASMGSRLDRHQVRQASSIPNVEVFESSFKLEWMKEPWRDLSLAGDWLLDLETRHPADIIHLNGYAHAVLPWRAPVLVAGHSCILSWWRAVKGVDAPQSFHRYSEAVRMGISAAQLIVAPSQAMLSALSRHYGPLPDSMVIYNGRNPVRFTSGRKENLILSAGRLWDEAKNIGSLAEIAHELSWPVYVAGESKHPDGINFAHEKVNLLGSLSMDELVPWFTRAAIYVLPARYEPFGLSVLEAALSGCALVLGDIPSLREIWQKDAVYVSPDDTTGILDALNKLITDQAQLTHLGRRARLRALNFDHQTMARHYLSAYSNLIRKQQHNVRAQPVCIS
ncbi:glycosyltransferase family 4 protein [Pedosphaera parvula]|nr:glycosyltransferase family 4 protein [Pedosphaera parvula]